MKNIVVKEEKAMKKICIVTTTRADYGLFRRIIKLINQDSKLNLLLVVTGTHLEDKYGNTIEEIEFDNFSISYKINMNMSKNKEIDIINSMAIAQKKFGKIYEKEKPDLLLILGDRYELIPICSSAMIFKIPIAHISGGEVTKGAIDDVVRHCITKMSYVHFPACEIYRKRIIQLGENPENIFNYGDLGVENIKKMKYLTKQELGETLDIDLSMPYVLLTFHPTTLENRNEVEHLNQILLAIEEMDMYQYIITKSNADLGGEMINKMLERYCETHNNAFLFSSLGSKKYISAIKYCEFVLGNSSSGFYEVPALRKPTINIGNRQSGRIKLESIINCEPKKEAIIHATKIIKNNEFLKKIENMVIPYDGNNTSSRIVQKIKEILYDKEINLEKEFFDIHI